MEISIAVVLIIIISVIAIIKRNIGDSDNTDIDEPEDLIDYNERFLNEIGDDYSIKAARVYSKKDMAILRSILQSSRINTFIENESLNNMLPGLAVEGYNDAILNIYNRDVVSAKEIIGDYIESIRTEKIEERYSIQGTTIYYIPELLI